MRLSLRLSVLLAAELAQAYITADGTVIIPGATSYNGLNLVPQMGWDNWNAYGCDVSEDLLLSTAKAMVDYGLRDLGYNYVVLDDCWSIGRNDTGYLVHNPQRFPNGMKYIADQLHSMGMKFGMYSSAGIYTCAKYPGSLGYETQDAEYFAENDVDYLKYDNCFNQGQSGNAKISFDRYNVMSQALNKTGQPVVYAMCSWGDDNPFDWAYTIANSARMSGDIYDSFNRPDERCACTTSPCAWPGFHCSVMNILNKMAAITSRTMPGFFNDMDMLEVGNGGQDDNEYVTHFSMWAMHSSPLLMGTNVVDLSAPNLAIYANPAVIAVNQDTTATAALLVWRHTCDDVDQWGQCEYSMWTRKMANGDMIVALINGANSTMRMNASLSDIFLDASTSGTAMPAAGLSQNWDVYDLWGSRMSNDEAQMLINGTAPTMDSASNSTTRYNATATSYADGVMANNTALFGTKTGSVAPHGTWSADIARHSVGFYRFRSQGTPAMRKRDEL